MPSNMLTKLKPPKWLTRVSKDVAKPGFGRDALTAGGLALGADIMAPHVSGEHLPWWKQLGVAGGSLMMMRGNPRFAKALRPFAIQGGLLKSVDMASRHNQGYSTLDPTSIESHLNEKMQTAAGRLVDQTYSAVNPLDRLSRADFLASVQQRIAMQQLAKGQVEQLFRS